MDAYQEWLATTTLREFLDAGGKLTWSPAKSVYEISGMTTRDLIDG